jgi:hypothetical protein
MPGVTLDAGGLIALDRDDRRVVVLLARARDTGARVTVPASVLAQAIRRPDRQVRLGTSDIADAHIVICARRADQPSSPPIPVTCVSLTSPSG